MESDPLTTQRHAIPVYHPLSELANRDGYYPNLSDQQILAATQLSDLINAEHDLKDSFFFDEEEHHYLKLLRFLRARKFVVRDAIYMIRENVQWRKENADLRNKTAKEILMCDLSKFYEFFPTYMLGKDRQMRAVSYRYIYIYI